MVSEKLELNEYFIFDLESYFDQVFALVIDPAQNKEAGIGKNGEKLTFQQLLEQFESNIPLQQGVTQAELTEKSYKTPTIEVEKKGLAKWFDELKQSSNPLAMIITGSMWKKQNNLLSAGEPQKYEDKPSTGRFDSTDTKLMPAGKGVRNSIIQAMDTISNVFRGNKKEKQPAKVIQPVTTFDDRYKYEVKSDSSRSDSVRTPITVIPKVDRKSGTPEINDGFNK